MLVDGGRGLVGRGVSLNPTGVAGMCCLSDGAVAAFDAGLAGARLRTETAAAVGLVVAAGAGTGPAMTAAAWLTEWTDEAPFVADEQMNQKKFNEFHHKKEAKITRRMLLYYDTQNIGYFKVSQ